MDFLGDQPVEFRCFQFYSPGLTCKANFFGATVQ